MKACEKDVYHQHFIWLDPHSVIIQIKMDVLLCFLRNCCWSNGRAIDKAWGRIGECVFLQRVGTAVFFIWPAGSVETPNHAGIFYWNSLNRHVGKLITNSSAVHGCFSQIMTLCVCSAQLPYLLLNATGTDPKVRMHPVFFGESIEVNPKPEQEIK